MPVYMVPLRPKGRGLANINVRAFKEKIAVLELGL